MYGVRSTLCKIHKYEVLKLSAGSHDFDCPQSGLDRVGPIDSHDPELGDFFFPRQRTAISSGHLATGGATTHTYLKRYNNTWISFRKALRIASASRILYRLAFGCAPIGGAIDSPIGPSRRLASPAVPVTFLSDPFWLAFISNASHATSQDGRPTPCSRWRIWYVSRIQFATSAMLTYKC